MIGHLKDQPSRYSRNLVVKSHLTPQNPATAASDFPEVVTNYLGEVQIDAHGEALADVPHFFDGLIGHTKGDKAAVSLTRYRGVEDHALIKASSPKARGAS